MHSPAIQPRVCGDYIESKIPNQSHPDTTPHVRGLRSCGYHATHNNRYNPACAGTTSSESAIWSVDAIPPPRVRGLLPLRNLYANDARYHPACAGTTAASCPCHHFIAIQPRVCGDYTASAISSLSLVDTTPRVRGLLAPRLVKRVVDRYNPACAGTTSFSSARRFAQSIQPRVCGDYSVSPVIPPVFCDTTPRVRGLPLARCYSLRLCRYNPACAGTTPGEQRILEIPPIQPRVCGDYNPEICSLARRNDTTPRVRGLHSNAFPATLAKRYNPACAGTTAATTTTSSPRPIQPRVCGDYRSQRVFMSSAFDTTPRVRGLRKKMCFIAIWERYNPACAGTTLLRSSRCKP